MHDARFALAKPLTFIINMAISKSIFPDRWKRARITPIFKKNDKKQIKNYRPIAIICNFAKVFEKIIYLSLFNNTRSLISTNQHGFVPARSAQTNLSVFTQFVCKVLD